MIPIHRTAYAYVLLTQDKPRRERGIFSGFVIGRKTGLRRRRGFDDWTGERSRDTDARAARRVPFGSSVGRVRGRRVSPTRGLPSGVAHASRLHSCLRGASGCRRGTCATRLKTAEPAPGVPGARPRRDCVSPFERGSLRGRKKAAGKKMERDTGFEPATSSLGSWRSTN